MAPCAKIIADSMNESGHRLTTMQVTFHRFVLAELNTHRTLSRSSASSRAIPVVKQLRRVQEDLAWPLSWPAEQKGMQGGESLSPETIEEIKHNWEIARDDMVEIASRCVRDGLHKSVVNRLLEPFMYHTAIISATAFENFFNQRCSPLAQPELRAAAELMQHAYWNSIPKLLCVGEWHLPYIQEDEMSEDQDKLIKVSVARCARVSYLTQDGVRDMSEDLALYERLVNADPPHYSPAEMVATPDLDNVHTVNPASTKLHLILPKYGNYVGWKQHRIEIEDKQGYQSFS